MAGRDPVRMVRRQRAPRNYVTTLIGICHAADAILQAERMRRWTDGREPPLDTRAPAAADGDVSGPITDREGRVVHHRVDDFDAVGAAAGNLAPHLLECAGLEIEGQRFAHVE